MNILFYIEPLIEQDKPYWKEGWANVFCKDIISTLRKSDHFYDFRLMTNEPIAQILNLDISIITLSQQELLKPFNTTNYLHVTSAWHLGSYTKKHISSYEKLMHSRLEDFIPDIIISFSPVPFFTSLFPSALIMYHEYSLFSRLPYPQSWFLDPVGMHSHLFLNQFQNEIKNIQLSDEQKRLILQFKSICQKVITTKSPFKDFFAKKKVKFDFLVFAPLQFSKYYSFDDLVLFKSQYEYCVYILDHTPSNIGVVVNMHPEYPVLSDEAIKFLKSKYTHFIYDEIFNTIYASGQFILPFVEGVITVSSSIGLQTLLFDKKLIALGKPCFEFIADATQLDNIEDVLQNSISQDKTSFLYFILSRHAITEHYLHDAKWLDEFMQHSLERYRDKGINFLFYDAIDTDEVLFKNLMEEVQLQAKMVPQYSQLPLVQLFIDQGYGFLEENSIKFPVCQNTEIQEFIFDLSNQSTIKALRLDPLNDSCVIEIESLHVKTKEGEIDLLPLVQSNAMIHHGKSYFFTTEDSQIYFDSLNETILPTSQILTVKIGYPHIGRDALHVIVKQTEIELEQTRAELFTIYESKSWKATMPLRKIEQILQGK